MSLVLSARAVAAKLAAKVTVLDKSFPMTSDKKYHRHAPLNMLSTHNTSMGRSNLIARATLRR